MTYVLALARMYGEADEIMARRNGKLVERGITRQIISQPQEQFTRALLSERSFDCEPEECGVTAESRFVTWARSKIKILNKP
jgi:ABC-type glutathione transport system ATPase component